MRTVFIVDDDNMYLMILKRRIEKMDSDVVIESYLNGLAASEELQKRITENKPLPDVILLDINMPVMDGWQFLKKVSTDFPQALNQIKTYIVSTSLEDRDRERALNDKHVTEYISKPIPPEKLKEIICI